VAQVPDGLRYTNDHEYARADSQSGVYVVGITDYAQGELGDVVFVNLPKVGDKVSAHQVFGTIEAVKAVADLYAPVAGTIVEINPTLDADPAVVNRDPYGEGWMIKLRPDNASDIEGLLSPDAYRSHIGA
jgi:glycine cleavage system H protein